MTRLLVGIDSAGNAEQLAEYCNDHLDEEDTVYAMNSLVGGDDTSAEDISQAEDALDRFEETYAGDVDKRSSLIRGNDPLVDLLEAAEEWGADEYLIGIRKRSPVGKVVFGSTARDLLLEADIPIRAVPLVSD